MEAVCKLFQKDCLFLLSLFWCRKWLPQISLADTLTDIYESALQNDPVLRAARASFNADRENKNIARGALLPQLSVSGDYTQIRN